MAIRNKFESDEMIKTLDLNRISEEVFTNMETNRLNKFLRESNCRYYNIRDKKSSQGRFLYKLTPEEILEQSKNYEVFSVYESLAEADMLLVLQGEILLTKDFKLRASLSDIKGISNRQAMKKPVYKINADLVYNKSLEPGEEPWYRIPYIRGFDDVITYICENDLIEVVVEFSLYDVPVGVKKEKIIIWELRNY